MLWKQLLHHRHLSVRSRRSDHGSRTGSPPSTARSLNEIEELNGAGYEHWTKMDQAWALQDADPKTTGL